MEKLQEALQKARADRANSAPPAREEAERPVGSWGEIPKAALDEKLLLRNRIVSGSQSRAATPFDILRTKVLLQMRKNGWRRLAITSATPSCGKSTIVANLALGLTRQDDLRAIVVELDMRNPSLAKMLGVTPPHDVSLLLSGKQSFEEQALRVGDNVAVSLAKKRSADPTRHLLNAQAGTALSDIERAHNPDLVIFDTAPILVSDDTRAFLSQVDCALIVARAESTTVGQIDTCEREIAELTNVLGVTLNQTRFVDEDQSYGYGYGYS